MLRKQLILLALVAAAAARTVDPSEARGDGSLLGELKSVYRVYSECHGSGGFSAMGTCLKLKLVSALDRAARSAGDLQVAEGVALVRDGSDPAPSDGQPKSEEQLSAELPRALGDRDAALDAMIADKALSFLSSHKLQLKFPTELVEEGRGKNKKMGGLLLLPLLMGAMLIPLALGGLALLAGKALLVSKLALVLAGIIGLKKLLSGSGGGHDSSYQVVSVPHHGRSLDAQDMAYRAHVPATSS